MLDNAAASRPLRDILMSGKPTPSYADFHHHITRNAVAESYLPDSSGCQQLDRKEGKPKEDELVRYMSNLPSYLERGKNLQGKPLNVGVLDWRRMEKWNCNNNPMSQPHTQNGCDSSTRITSYFSTEGSSSHSNKAQSSSPAQQRPHHPSLQSHLEASPMKTYTQEKFHSGGNRSDSPNYQRSRRLVPHAHPRKVYPLEGRSYHVDPNIGNAKKFNEMPASIPSHGIRQQNPYGTDQILGRNQYRVRQEIDEKKEMGGGKLKIRESELKEAMQSRNSNLGHCHPDSSKEQHRVVLLVPRDAMNREIENLHDSVGSSSLKPRECAEKSFSKQGILREVHGSGLPSSVSYSKPLHVQEDSKKNIETCPRNVLGSKVSFQQPSSSSISRNNKEKKPIFVLKSSNMTRPPGEVGNIHGSQSTDKVRRSSPIRRLGSAVGSIIRSAGSRDNSPFSRSSLQDAVAQPRLDRAAVSASSDADKAQANSRAGSSPLRRLLDPIIKPKAQIAHELAGTPRKDVASTTGPWKSSDEQVDLLEAKSTLGGGRTNGARNSHQNVKKGSCRLRAHLQVAEKNGLPLFTFAVDNGNDILAATLGNLNAAYKDHPSWMYTFFTVHKVKRKSALWPNQGSKCNGHYVPNVVAQMKVSGHQVSVGIRRKGVNDDDVREFALFSVDVGQGDQQATVFQPANELAAIVVKLEATTPQDNHSARSKISMSTTLILPGDVHTIPSKGSISSLMQRWRSGGSCDCGGWDVGCQLRTFTNQGVYQVLLNSSKANEASDVFKLFSQAGEESQLILSLTPLKDSIHSVVFDSSVSHLQAFATCVAALDCRTPSGYFGTSNMN